MLTTPPSKNYIILSLLGAFIPFFAILWMTMVETGGFYEYPLDDPYIHLAMSEQIANGEYGVNAGEYASASSSIIYPVLLAPFNGFEWHALTPLFWGVAALLGAASLWGHFVSEVASRSDASIRSYLLALAFIGPFFLHLVGTSLMGMEHALQALAAMMVAYGLVRYSEGDGIKWFLIAGVIASPLIRFEGLAVSCFACGVLLLSGRPKFAIGLGIAAVLPVLAHFAVMHSIGLAPLPNSVMAKSAIAGGDIHFATDEKGSQLEALIGMITSSVSSPSGATLILLAVFWVAAAWIWRETFGRTGVLIALSMSALITAHLLLGSTGRFLRYEIYVWCYAAVISTYLLSKLWNRFDAAKRYAPLLLFVGLFVGGHHFPLQAYFIYPDAGAAIAHQQRQLARLIDDHIQAPVAVNDLGHVSYRNPHYVLDLWGLASREALDARFGERNPHWADHLIERYDVGVVMIYDHWFEGRVNPGWTKVAELTIHRRMGALGGTIVAIYAVTPDDVDKLRADLEAFSDGIPEGSELEILM